ncbi:MAG: DUF1634 domain-containing protein [Niabella sp.]
MQENKSHTTNNKLAIVIGNIMRWGVIISLSLTFLGGVIYLSTHGHEPLHFETFTEKDYSVVEILQFTFSGLLQFDGLAIITLGILLLLATPVIRVLFSLFDFIFEKDWLYVMITLIVLLIIAISISGGWVH